MIIADSLERPCKGKLSCRVQMLLCPLIPWHQSHRGPLELKEEHYAVKTIGGPGGLATDKGFLLSIKSMETAGCFGNPLVVRSRLIVIEEVLLQLLSGKHICFPYERSALESILWCSHWSNVDNVEKDNWLAFFCLLVFAVQAIKSIDSTYLYPLCAVVKVYTCTTSGSSLPWLLSWQKLWNRSALSSTIYFTQFSTALM